MCLHLRRSRRRGCVLFARGSGCELLPLAPRSAGAPRVPAAEHSGGTAVRWERPLSDRQLFLRGRQTFPSRRRRAADRGGAATEPGRGECQDAALLVLLCSVYKIPLVCAPDCRDWQRAASPPVAPPLPERRPTHTHGMCSLPAGIVIGPAPQTFRKVKLCMCINDSVFETRHRGPGGGPEKRQLAGGAAAAAPCEAPRS